MRLWFIVVSSTWLLAFVLRALAKAQGETVENTRRAAGPPLAWWLHGLQSASTQLPAASPVLVLLILGAIVVLWWRFRPTPLSAIGGGLFIGGGAANTTERVALGGVTDYIPISWPADYLVNFTDLAIVAGGVLLTISLVSSLGRR